MTMQIMQGHNIQRLDLRISEERIFMIKYLQIELQKYLSENPNETRLIRYIF
jgi:hypothetical protein